MDFFKLIRKRSVRKPDTSRTNLVPAIEYKDTYRDKMFALFDWQAGKKLFFATNGARMNASLFVRKWYRGVTVSLPPRAGWPTRATIPGLVYRVARSRPLTATQFYRFMNNY